MLETLITSKTRLKVLLKFFLNGNNQAYLRGLSKELSENSNAIRQELNRFEEAGMLKSTNEGNKKLYKANTSHPLYIDIQNIIRKFVGIDQLIERVIDRLGNVFEVYLDGEIAKGIKSDIIDTLIIGDEINREYMLHLVQRAEPLIGKKIKFLVLSIEEGRKYVEERGDNLMLIWKA